MTSDDDKQVSPHAQTLDAAAVQDPLEGTTLGHYRIVSRLGQGGMGVVYRAEDEKLRRVVALKVLLDTSSNEERRQRFLREARSAAAISHPNVAVVHAVDEAHGRIYIAMELVEGENLRQRLERGRLDVPSAKNLALQIAQGLAAAHEKGLVHRDLKPENVMITSSGQVKLLDFGLAKAGAAPASGKTAAAMARTETVVTSDDGRIMGTPEYMSPEQALGEPVDVRSDVFSLGIVMYEMLSGVRPFGGTTTGAILVAIARDAAPPLREKSLPLDDATEALVMRCLSKAKEQRPGSASEVVAALMGATSSNAKIPSQDAAVAVSRSSAIARGGTTRMAAALTAVAIVAAGGWWALARGHKAATTSGTTGTSPAASADDGMSRSSNPVAQAFFDHAVLSFQDGTGQAKELLEHAIQADPTFGAAYVRLLIVLNLDTLSVTDEDGKKADEYLTRCRVLEPTLSPRDRALFTLLDASPQGAELDKYYRDFDAYLARHPDDTFAWMWLDRTDRNPPAALDRALAAVPTLVPALARKAEQAQTEQDGGVEPFLERCFLASPRAVDCLAVRSGILSRDGKCSESLTDVRRWLALQPDSRDARDMLAKLLAAQGSPIESIGQAMGEAQSAGGRMRGMVSLVRGTHLPLYAGDLTEVLRVAQHQALEFKSSLDPEGYFLPSVTQVIAYNEIGDLAGAGRVAADYLARMRPSGRPILRMKPTWS